MRALVLGSGAREHCLAWRLSIDPDVTEVLCGPGNPGAAQVARVIPVDLGSPDAVLDVAGRERIDLTVVGPEAPLERGLADRFRRAGRAIVGPSQYGANLECSKAFAKAFMARHDIPTAEFVVAESVDEALEAVSGDRFGFPVVVKADGLAAGKGVVIAEDREQAETAVRASMVDRQFGAAGARLVIEEYLSGPEVSFFVVTDGHDAVELGTAHDHKRMFDGDLGPNTGGMGAYAPSPTFSQRDTAEIMARVVRPVLDGLSEEGHPYRGFLYVSLMLTTSGYKVIEFNVRLGDPETQVILPLLDGPFARLLMASAQSSVRALSVSTKQECAVGVVLASRGYPASSSSGDRIRGLEASLPDNTLVFHAGTRRDGEHIVTAGGRVLTVVGRGKTYDAAMRAAYRHAATIHFDGMQFRRDIGKKAL